MNKKWMIGVGLAALLVAGVIVGAYRTPGIWGPVGASESPAAEAIAPVPAPRANLPLLLDLGSKRCIPCRMMEPILDELTRDYAGQFDVKFIDVWLEENSEQARKYGVKVIPLQIFFDANGKELWRHEGFISKDDILAKWKELGLAFEASAQNELNESTRQAD